MADENLPYGGFLGGGPRPYNMAMAERAFRQGWPISPEIRQQCIDQAFRILSSAKSPRTRLHAIKVLMAADMLNVKREQLEVQERHNVTVESAAAIRAALAVPGVREQLAAIMDQSADVGTDTPKDCENLEAKPPEIDVSPDFSSIPSSSTFQTHARPEEKEDWSSYINLDKKPPNKNGSNGHGGNGKQQTS